MFIDGSGVANLTNNGIKLIFGTTGTLTKGGSNTGAVEADTFEVKDLGVFELLKNFKDAIDNGDDAWISQNAGLLDKAVDLISKNNAVIAFQGTQANTLISSNRTKDAQLESIQSLLTDANINELAVQYNVLLLTYQSLLATLAKMQNVSILDYL
jgi:flagellin-like hook-associated protein FlgL